jgi:hypothetical protein
LIGSARATSVLLREPESAANVFPPAAIRVRFGTSEGRFEIDTSTGNTLTPFFSEVN